jgi:hypothetical protein
MRRRKGVDSSKEPSSKLESRREREWRERRGVTGATWAQALLKLTSWSDGHIDMSHASSVALLFHSQCHGAYR